MFAAAFLFLLGSVAAVSLAQFRANTLADWISMSYSLGAVVLTIVAVAMRGER